MKMKGPESFGGIETRNEAQIEQVERVKNELRNALIMNRCTDIDGFQACMMEWLDKNEDLFEASYQRLLDLKPESLDDWDSVNQAKRAEIMDIIEGEIVGRDSHREAA
jgi:hypothetical protein